MRPFCDPDFHKDPERNFMKIVYARRPSMMLQYVLRTGTDAANGIAVGGKEVPLHEIPDRSFMAQCTHQSERMDKDRPIGRRVLS